jgi:hypothetical protein
LFIPSVPLIYPNMTTKTIANSAKADDGSGLEAIAEPWFWAVLLAVLDGLAVGVVPGTSYNTLGTNHSQAKSRLDNP